MSNIVCLALEYRKVWERFSEWERVILCWKKQVRISNSAVLFLEPSFCVYVSTGMWAFQYSQYFLFKSKTITWNSAHFSSHQIKLFIMNSSLYILHEKVITFSLWFIKEFNFNLSFIFLSVPLLSYYSLLIVIFFVLCIFFLNEINILWIFLKNPLRY